MLLVLLLILPILLASLAGAQETPSQTQPPTPTTPTPSPVIPPPSNRPGQPGVLPIGPPFVLGPDGKPFVPPVIPAPSQTRIPGAFDPSSIPTGAPHFTFSPSLSLIEEYTDNFFITGHGRTDNLRSTLSAGLALLINLPNTQGSLSTSLAASHDTARNDEDISYFPSFTGTVQHTFTPRLSLVVSDTFRRDDDPVLADKNGLQRTRSTFISNSFSVAVNWLVDVIQTQAYYRNSLFISNSDTTISHILGADATMPVGVLNSLTVGYELTLRNGSNDNQSSSNNNQFSSNNNQSETGHRVWASIARQLGAFTSAGVSTSFSYISGNTDSRIGNISLFAAYGTPAGLSVSGSVGYGVFDSDGASRLTHLFTATLAASYRFVGGGVVSLGFFQDFRQTADEGPNFGIVATRAVNGSFSYPITPFINGSVFAQYSRSEPVSGGGSQISSAQSTFTAGASLGWQILTWLSLDLSYNYIDRQSDRSSQITSSGNQNQTNNTAPNLENSTENRATLTLSARF